MRNKNKGFSLIEVAIAIIVIGMVASMVLKGKELIHSAKLRSVAEQVSSIKIATQTFVDKYGMLPGDFNKAKEMIGESVQNGAGNGHITSLEDAKRFWSHLNVSKLLSFELVNGMPASKIGGSYSVSSNIPGQAGTWLILSGGTANNKAFTGIISQDDAHYIDKNNDDGNPSDGEICTMKAGGSELTPIGQLYDPRIKNKDYVIMFRLW